MCSSCPAISRSCAWSFEPTAPASVTASWLPWAMSWAYSCSQSKPMDFGSLSPGVILITVVSLALAPFVAVMVTSFTKIVVVLSLLRNALGLQQTPPNVVINGLALILTLYIMFPVVQAMTDRVQ